MGEIQRSVTLAKTEGKSALTPRETEILAPLAKGFSIKGCADWLGLSTSAISDHKARAMGELGCPPDMGHFN